MEVLILFSPYKAYGDFKSPAGKIRFKAIYSSTLTASELNPAMRIVTRPNPTDVIK